MRVLNLLTIGVGVWAIVSWTQETTAFGDNVVVTGVHTVEAPTRVAALEKCQGGRPGGVSVGMDWGTSATGGLLHLCQMRRRTDDIDEGTSVLQRLAVFSAPACPYKLELVASPRKGVVVCAGYAPLTKGVLTSGDYIVDLAVTSERNYNNDAPGWTTLPYSLHTTPIPLTTANRGVYLSIRQPVRPIVAVDVLKSVATDVVLTACADTLGVGWRAAVDVGFLDEPEPADAKTLLCVKRQDASAEASSVVLSQIGLVNATSACDVGFQLVQALTTTTLLCAKWMLPDAASSFVADLVMHRVSTALGEENDPTAAEFLPGGFQLVVNRNLNTAKNATPVYLFARKWQPTVITTTPTQTKPPLTAQYNATSQSLSFKILQIADLHYTGDPTYPCRAAPTSLSNCTESVMTQWVDDLLDVEKPDFVAFSGDNIETFTVERRQPAMDAVRGGVEARSIPYGLVFGNHDDDNGFPREEVVKLAMSKPHSYTQRGPFEVDGVSNYELSVQAPADGPWGAKGSDVFRMYFLDSHGFPDKSKYPLVNAKYDWVKPNQISFYRKLSEAHTAAHNSVPAVMFFHIPLVEFAANAPSKTNGQQFRPVSSSNVSTNLFSTLVDMGEVKATFVGHDHVNEYCYKREGIQLCYGGSIGLGRAYGLSEFARRARIIEWRVDAQGKRSIRSWKRLFGALSSRWLEEELYSETT